MISIKDLLLIESFSLEGLIEEYRVFFLTLLPSIFMLALVVEYFDRLEPFILVKRAVISILILTSVTSFYHKAIQSSMEQADKVLDNQKRSNLLLMDMLSGTIQWKKIKKESFKKDFYKNEGAFIGTINFIKYHLFSAHINDALTSIIYLISKLCFLILKVVYSLVYYLGYGLIGIPCLIYLFPSMGNVLRGATLSFVWCLSVPHILVFIISLIGTEINKGYVSGQIIGGSMTGTALLLVLTLFIAFTPLIGSKILAGAGVSSAGGVIGAMGAHFVMNIPKNIMSAGVTALSTKSLGPKMGLASKALGSSYKFAAKTGGGIREKVFSASSFGKGKSNFKASSKPDFKEVIPKGIPVKDVKHISQEMKKFQESMNSSSSVNRVPKFRNASESKFSLSTNQSKGVRNGKVQEYRNRNSESKKTNSNNRSGRDHNQSSGLYKRNVSNQKNRK